MKEKVPFKKALRAIFTSLVCLTSLALLVLAYVSHVKSKQQEDEAFKIVALAQVSGNPQALKTVYLAELLGLSLDRPMNLYRFNVKEAKERLLASSLIKEAEILKLKPGTLFVDYTLRTPLAFLGDFSNTALDAEGVLIPFKPFFTPKKLPVITLGLSTFGEGAKEGDEEGGKWGRPLQGPRAQLALELLNLISRHCCSESLQLTRIDVSRAYALSYGQRQIIVVFEERLPTSSALIVFPVYVRLSPSNFRQELANYLVLREHLHKNQDPTKGAGVLKGKTHIVDLRVPQLGYFKTL